MNYGVKVTTSFLLISLAIFSHAGYLDDWTDDQICGWMDNPSPPEHMVEEAVKRNLECAPESAKKKAQEDTGLQIMIYDADFSESDLASLSSNDLDSFESVKTSNAFDGSYWFAFIKINPDGAIVGDGYGPLLINDGIVTVGKSARGGYNGSGQMSPTFFNNFNGKIDKNGDVIARFIFSVCAPCGLEEKLVMFNGNIKSQKLSGMFDDVEVIFDMR